jgi:gamma-glutamyltranspeptidase/glutathione hydrolase
MRSYVISAYRGCLFPGVAFLFLAGWGLSQQADAPRRGMVASVHPVATQAGLKVLKEGGNAVDAAVAVALTLGVVDTDNSGIGGGCFMLIRRANGSFAAIDGREMAPAAATRDMFVRNGKPDTGLSQTGPLASGVPGALAAYDLAVKKYGTKKLKELLLPAANVAEKGFRLDKGYARPLKMVADEMSQFESSRAVFFKGDAPLGEGDLLTQPDLARTYRAIAEQGSAWFYHGPFAQAVEGWMKQHGGIITAQDFRHYKVESREPVRSSYRQFQIVTFPPPSSGGVHVTQMLNILEHFDLKSMAEPERLHVIAEAMKLAFADRAYWLGDPDFAKVPRGLIDKEYGSMLARKIDRGRAIEVASHGTPPGWQKDLFKKHTTHFSVADSEGNWVACTATINTSFGSKVVIPGTGVVMNNEMDDFSVQPGVANFFGLVGAEANAVAPGKRPLSSMSPTIVLKEGKPVIALGAAGGPKIISQVLLELVGMVDLGMSPIEAIAQPRIHHQWSPDELMIEESLNPETVAGLERRGHKLRRAGAMGISQIVACSPDGKAFLGAADPRAGGLAAGW